MKYIIMILFWISWSPLFCHGGERPVHPQIKRVMKMATSTPEWGGKKLLSDKMWWVREKIGDLDIVSDPVSDRYLITKLGGPIDLVHFLALCAQTCSGEKTVEKALLDQWKAEGGEEHLKGLSRTYYPEAHPDDLPSNAFGALLGSELKRREGDPNADLGRLLDEFFKPLRPVPDQVAKKYSHQYIVMGLPVKPVHETLLSRSEWFTATPLFMLSALDPNLKFKAPNAAAGLRLAGFEVYDIDSKPVGIRRISR